MLRGVLISRCRTGDKYTNKGVSPLLQLSDIHFSILGLLAECGCVSRPMFDLMGYSYKYLIASIKTLVDTNAVRIYGKGRGRHYALGQSGRKHLAAYNPLRYSPSVLELNKQLSQHPDRAMLRGDAAAMLSLAGYAVHPDDKPPLPAYTPPLPQPPDYQHWRNLTMHTYPAGEDRREYGRRLTAIGAYYDATVVKGLLPTDGDKDKEGVNYSRACGVLMTPDHLLRVFHSRDVALKLKLTGETNFKKLLFSDEVYGGFMPDDREAVLVFGNDFSAARLIIEHHLYGHKVNLPYYVKRNGSKGGYEAMKGTGGELLGPANLGNPAYYLPLDKAGLELLPLFQFPRWTDTLHRNINRRAFDVTDQPKWSYERDGRIFYVLASLNLPQIAHALRTIKNDLTRPFAIACLDWQTPLFSDLLLPYMDRDILVKRMPPDFMDEVANDLPPFAYYYEIPPCYHSGQYRFYRPV